MPRVKSMREDRYFPGGKKSEGVGARVGGRLKKAKIVFDPSINNMPKKITRSLSVNVETLLSTSKNNKTDNIPKKSIKTMDSPPVLEVQVNDYCMICGKVDARKAKKIIACKDCNSKVHSSCLKIAYLNHALLEEHWRCDNCRTCVVCYETSEAGPLISCCVCVDAYHLSCHNPNPKIHSNKNLNKCKWECAKCQNINKHVMANKTSSIDDRKPSSPTPSEICLGSKNPKESRDKKLEKTVTEPKKSGTKMINRDDHIPDISDWSCERVSKYMEKYFPNEAHVFRENEIDGASLLLMKRSDIISCLALKLGPAIRIYSFVVQLQSQSNDPRLTWM